MIKEIKEAMRVYRHNWTCHDCEGYDNATNPPNDKEKCENCQKIANLLRKIEAAITE